MEDVLTKIGNYWKEGSQLADLHEPRWAKNKKLANSQHLTPRKVGRSNLFIPKIEQYIRRKLADFVGTFTGNEPISMRRTMTSSKEGARIFQEVANYYLLHSGINWDAIIFNGAQNALNYEFAPAKISWERGTTTEQVEEETLDENGEIQIKIIDQEVETYSHPVIDVIPPEDFRIDGGIGWDEVGRARFYIHRTWRDRAYAEEQERQGIWPHLDEGMFNDNPASKSGNLSTIRAAQQSPFSESFTSDNGLIEIWECGYYEDLGDGLEPVVTVSVKDTQILEEPQPVEVPIADPDGSDPWGIVVGSIYAEAHELYKRALPEKLEGLQLEKNAMRNQRRDNVNLVLNREKYTTPNSGLDPALASFSFPGKVNVVRSKNDVWWDAPPDVTASSYNEEQINEQDMDILAAEGPNRAGAPAKRKETATASSLMASGSQASIGLDTTIFHTTYVRALANKLIRMIKMAGDPELFVAAADKLGIEIDDPYREAIFGNYDVSVSSGAVQVLRDSSISNASNISAVIASVYGPNANYQPIMKPMLEANDLDPDLIIPPPPEQQSVDNPAFLDMGGVSPQDGLNVQPRVQQQGGSSGFTSNNAGN